MGRSLAARRRVTSSLVTQREVQALAPTIDRVRSDPFDRAGHGGAHSLARTHDVHGAREHPEVLQRPAQERAARDTLKGQIARLERELSAVVARGFPHIRPTDAGCQQARSHGPRLLSLGELERLRDALAARVQEARAQSAERDELARRSLALLGDMRREPRRHKFVRLPVADLGEGGCGVWEVRPRLGLIGMLAGWWQVKLSSGCP